MLALLILAAATVAAPSPTVGPVDNLRQIVVDAIRACPKAAEGEIVVCSRDRGLAEGYRIPRLDPRYAGRGALANRQATLAGPSVGATGVGSCSATGAGSTSGCGLAAANAWGAWKRQEKADGRPFPW